MFFPLGLGFKLKSTPYATWLIILVCSSWYAASQYKLFIGAQNDYNLEYISLYEHNELNRAHDLLFYEHCKRDLPGLDAKGVCQRFALERGLLFDPNFLDSQLEKEDNPEQYFAPQGDLFPSPETILEFTREYQRFSEDLIKEKAQAQKLHLLPSYLLYKESFAALKSKTQKIRKENNLLHHDNLNFTSLLNAIFSHESFMHLFGNMLFLFIFGRYVEARVGSALYLAGYLVLGSLALGLYAYLTPFPYLSVLGASANVSVVMGAFYTLFFHNKLKVFFFYIVSKIVSLPVKTYMFLFFMLQEFILSLTSSTNVAYLAHGLGLVLGMAAGILVKRLDPVPTPFLYKSEVLDWTKAKAQNSKSAFIDDSLEILKYNPDNTVVLQALVDELASPERDLAGLDLDEELLLRSLIPSYLYDLHSHKKFEELYKLVQRIPHSWSMAVCLSRFSQKQMIELIDQAIDEKRLLSAVLFIQAFVEKFKRSPKNYNLLKTLKSVLDHIPLTDSCRSHLEKIRLLSTSTALKTAIGSRLLYD